MRDLFIKSTSLPDFPLWDKMKKERKVISFDLEITSRCNNNCRHCYINLPVKDKTAKENELSLVEIKRIAEEAVSLGAIWCLITGGEPLLREDFFEIYLLLKQKGLLTSVFTNATLLSNRHIKFFKKYPPRDIEVTVYGTTKETYERVTRRPGSFAEFMQGVNLLLKNNLKVRFKAMALRSNVEELPEIANFCRQRTKDYFRFDPFLHLRLDRNNKRNAEIKSERLSAQEIVTIEKADPQRSKALEKNCAKLIHPEFSQINCNHLFHCGAGNSSFTIGYDGSFRLCSSLVSRECTYDLKKGSLKEAWREFIPKVKEMRSNRKEFIQRCRKCELVNLCMWCPAHADLETARLDEPVEYFCKVAFARKEMLTPA